MYNQFTYPLPVNNYNRYLLEPIKKEAEKLLDADIKALPYSNFKLLEETGSRVEYEIDYMEHRKMLCAFAGMALAQPEEPKWLEKLCDVIWAICDEYTWALPAHLQGMKEPEKISTRLDLFSCETGMALSEIYHIMGDKLPKPVQTRMLYELERRIVQSYIKNPRRFGISNWSAVCICGVGSTFIYLGKDEEFAMMKEHILQSIQDFLASYPEDGCCLEGSLYWDYGFSFFCFFAELLRQYTKGEIDYFQMDKVKKIAYFGQNSYLREEYVVSFADAPHTMKYGTGLWGLLSEKYEGIIIPDIKYAIMFGDDLRFRFAPFIRSLYWGKEPKTGQAEDKRCIYYEDAKWYINKKFPYVFAAKAGHNDEPHNHNDVGSFLLLDDGKFVLDDIGWPEYTRDYFSEKRYENICASSLGHPVPIVDGSSQKPGEEFNSEVVKVTEDCFVMEMAKAYGVETLTKLTREFHLREDGIVIKDSAEGSYSEFIERFTTREKPELCGDQVVIGDYTLSASEKAEISISDVTFYPRFKGFIEEESDLETAYQIDFKIEHFTQGEFILKKNSK
ncbi:MAG: heparinase II/III family protein [Clostridia bacterium]|nr:heparinase II/III family protein [Clostridia bacterium]